MEDIDKIVLEMLRQGLKKPEIRVEFIKNQYNTNGEPISTIIKRLKEDGKITKEEINEGRKTRNAEAKKVERSEVINNKKSLEQLYMALKEQILQLYKKNVFIDNIARKLSTKENVIYPSYIYKFIKRMKEEGTLTDDIELERQENIKIEKQKTKQFRHEMHRYKNNLGQYELKRSDLPELRKIVQERMQNIVLDDVMFVIKAHTQLSEFDSLIQFLQSIFNYLGELDSEEVRNHIEKLSKMQQYYSNGLQSKSEENITSSLEGPSID